MIKIPVCYSFDTQILTEFQKDFYVKIGCGGYKSDKMDAFDSDGLDNISFMNKYLNEMTMIWWMARNYKKLGNPDYIGTAHYRRYLKFTDNDLNSNTILCVKEHQPYSVYQTYQLYHVKSDLDAFIGLFSRAFPQYADDLIEYFNQNTHAKCNLFVMSRDLFTRYCDVICPSIKLCWHELMSNAAPSIMSRDKYQCRAPGFIMERMTGFWIWLAEKRGWANAVNTEMVTFDLESRYQRN